MFLKIAAIASGAALGVLAVQKTGGAIRCLQIKPARSAQARKPYHIFYHPRHIVVAYNQRAFPLIEQRVRNIGARVLLKVERTSELTLKVWWKRGHKQKLLRQIYRWFEGETP